MSESDDRLAQALQKVAAAFDARLPERMRQLGALRDAWQRGEAGAEAALQRELHRLRGTAASYGYQALSRQLREAEQLLQQDARDALRAAMEDLLARPWQRDTPLA